jgi:hypothetical protein
LYSSATGDVGLVVGVGGGEQGLAEVRLALVVLFDHHQLLVADHHGALGRVVETHHEAGRGLLAIGFERAGLAVDVRDLDVLRVREACGDAKHAGHQY